MSDAKVIIELLLLPRMVVWKRSPPMSKEVAEERVKLYAEAETFCTRIVPAEKYKKEARTVDEEIYRVGRKGKISK